MFEQLTEKLQKTLKYIRGEGKITEKNIAEALKMLRLAFLRLMSIIRSSKNLKKKLRPEP